jgi:dATP/dGTP diphosphohydrolase
MADFLTKDSGARKEFPTGMRRDINDGKPRYDLVIPLQMQEPLLKRWAELMARGADKYGERNWEKAGTLEEGERYRDSAFRHFMQWFMGETDEDHAAAVFFNIQGAEYVKEQLNTRKPEDFTGRGIE